MCFVCIQRHKQNVDQAFMHLADAFYQMYQSKIEMFKGIG